MNLNFNTPIKFAIKIILHTTYCIAIAIEIAFFKFITFDSSNWLHLNCKIGIKSRKYKYTQCIHSIMFVQK